MADEITELAGDTAEESPVSTPEAELEPEVAAEEAPASEESPESEREPEAEKEEGSKEEESDDFLLDLDPNTHPSDDDIDKLRIKPEDKQRLKGLSAENVELKGKLERVGGDFEIDAVSPLAQALSKAKATEEELAIIGRALNTANAAVTEQLFEGGTYYYLSTPSLGDPVLKDLFGENASIQNIKKLLALDKAEFFDKESADYFLNSGESEAYQNLLARLEQSETRAKDLEDAMRDPNRLAELVAASNSRGTQAARDFDTDFHAELPGVLRNTFAQVHWGEGAHSKLVTELLLYRLSKDPDYEQTVEYLKTHGRYRDGDKITPLAHANLFKLQNKMNAQGRQLIRELQLDFREISQNSLNARRLKEKQEAELPKSKEEAKPTEMNNVPGVKTQNDIDSKYRGRLVGGAAKAAV